MFAEDVGLLPRRSFSELLESLRSDANKFRPMVQALWHVMNAGGFSPILRDDLLRFNGGLFENSEALTLTEEQLALLIERRKRTGGTWSPRFFRHATRTRTRSPRAAPARRPLTPRAYVERLVMPTIIEPLREEWENVRAAAVTLANTGQSDKAIAEVEGWHQRLCAIRVLDPACGSGNFLYVTLEHMKRLEGEVLDLLRGLGDRQYTGYIQETDRHAVDPHQFLGIEKNPPAAAIADLVLWIGYLQWHFRTRGRTMPAQPVLKNFKNIECRDAILAWDRIELVCDEQGKPVTRWDGRTFKGHPVTGKSVPDETARLGSKSTSIPPQPPGPMPTSSSAPALRRRQGHPCRTRRWLCQRFVGGVFRSAAIR
jgi:MmeI, DNA-methyltransferase domain/MmeI, helicase spacer domain